MRELEFKKQPTPGPWASRHFNAAGSIDIDAGAHKMARVYCRELPGGVVTDEAISEAEANARLIAAAPHLLSALRAICNVDGYCCDKLREMYAIASEAIRPFK